MFRFFIKDFFVTASSDKFLYKAFGCSRREKKGDTLRHSDTIQAIKHKSFIKESNKDTLKTFAKQKTKSTRTRKKNNNKRLLL